jgi:hypothetical protein
VAGVLFASTGGRILYRLRTDPEDVLRRVTRGQEQLDAASALQRAGDWVAVVLSVVFAAVWIASISGTDAGLWLKLAWAIVTALFFAVFSVVFGWRVVNRLRATQARK